MGDTVQRRGTCIHTSPRPAASFGGTVLVWCGAIASRGQERASHYRGRSESPSSPHSVAIDCSGSLKLLCFVVDHSHGGNGAVWTHPLSWGFPAMVAHDGCVSTASPQVPKAALVSPPAQGLPRGAGDNGTTARPTAGPWLCPKTAVTKSLIFIFWDVLFTLASSLLGTVLKGW